MEDVNQSPRRWLKPALLVSLSSLPCLASLLGAEAVPRGRPLAEKRQVASLAMAQYSVNLREVPPVGTIPAQFLFINQGTRPLTVTKLEGSCGCLAPRLPPGKNTFEPGEEGQFMVSVKTATETPGPKLFHVTVKYDDGEPREQLVTFRLVVPEKKVSVTPTQLHFYQLKGEAGTHEIKVVDERGKNLRVLDVTSPSGNVTADVGERKISRDGTLETAIQVNVPAGIPPGREVTKLVIHTDDPEFPTIQVPVMLEGPWQPSEELLKSKRGAVQQVSGTR